MIRFDIRGRHLLALALATILTAAAGTSASADQSAGHGGDIQYADSPSAIPDSYIVVLRDDAARTSDRAAVAATATQLSSRYGGTVGHVYSHAVKGFEVRLPEPAARRLAADPTVSYVEQDQSIFVGPGVQLNPPSWGLDRIDQRYLPLDGKYAYPNTAHNVNAYIIGTGIRSHSDFPYRVMAGVDIIDGTLPADDCNGHGTHLAGTVGGTLYGVAKEVWLHPVRVLNCSGSGSYSQVIAGVDWVTANAIKPAVALMALGGGASIALDDAVTRSINSGVTYVVAAGSSGTNACNYSPARVPAAITVAGTTSTDARMPSGDYGSCLDLYAPGANITSTWNTSSTATATLSGNSMAAAHVAGCAALALSDNPTWLPSQVANYLIGRATPGVVTGIPLSSGTPNRLVYCGA